MGEQKMGDTPFFQTVLGNIIRWVAFIPVGFLLGWTIEWLIGLLVLFICNNLILSLLLVIIFGIPILGIVLLGFVWYGWTIYLSTNIICPEPKLGIGIFSVLYLITRIGGSGILQVPEDFSILPQFVAVIFVILFILFCIVGIGSLILSYLDEMNK